MKFLVKKNVVLANGLVLFMSAISACVGLVLWFMIRDTLMVILLYNSFNKWKLPAVDNFTFLILGMTWLVFVLMAHYFYNKGMKHGSFLAHFFFISGIQAFLLLICEVIMFSVDSSKGINSILLISGECLIGLILVFFALRRNLNQPKDKKIISK
ncbi:hypothetical protein [Bacillus sp. FSL K6-3431]|uniref:hypothetical protein n=1 Tax=Bacillus sp. FSL K6-3431 TaxID=2921500 RepID=UPI0030F84FD4